MKRRNFVRMAALAGPLTGMVSGDLQAENGKSSSDPAGGSHHKPSGEPSPGQAHCALIQSEELQAIVGDCSRNGAGGMQYCGLWSLTSKHRVFNCFGNSYAGLLPGELRGREGVTLEMIDDKSAGLYKTATDKDPTESRAIYTLVSPNSLEHTLTFRDGRSRIGSNGYREVSWCSYMNSPEDIRLNFLSGGKMTAYISPQHGIGSRVAPSYIPQSQIEKTPPQDEKWRPFHVNWAELKFNAPFYYGRLGQMTLLYIFDNPDNLRFYCSPSGGGGSLVPGKSSPAWDFLWIVPDGSYQVGKEFSFRLRMIYKPYVSDEDIIGEANRVIREWKRR